MTTADTSYDAVPYESLALQQTHPARLGAVALLLDVPAAVPSRSRVLEIGCAGGHNLLSMAVGMPEASFLGIDLSRVQIEQGRKLKDELGIRNVVLEQMDLADTGPALGTFDYIIAHGVFSWVPHALQEKMFELCRQLLAPSGIAYISYNTLPGWHSRRIVRDAMRYHALPFADPRERAVQARGILDFLAREASISNSNRIFEAEVALLANQPDSYLLHEHLEDENTAFYFHEFIGRAQAHGLQYLGEAEFGSMLPEAFAPHVRDTLKRIAPDVIRREQMMDFLRNRLLRQTLLVRSEVSVARNLAPERLHGLWVSGAVRAAGTPTGDKLTFVGASGVSVTTANALTQRALGVLGEIFPESIDFESLVDKAGARLRPYSPWRASPEDREVLALDLLHCFAAGTLELTSIRMPLAAVPGPQPAASPLARAQARAGQAVSTLRHEAVRLAPELAELLVLLDGTQDADALLRKVPGMGDRGNVERALHELGANALLVA